MGKGLEGFNSGCWVVALLVPENENDLHFWGYYRRKTSSIPYLVAAVAGGGAIKAKQFSSYRNLYWFDIFSNF